MPGDITGSLVYDRTPRSSPSARDRSSPTCCWPTRSTGRRRRPRRRCSRRWRSARSRSTATPRPLPQPFLVAATQNPVEYEGTYPLPEAQLDRFLLKVVLPLPPRERRARRCCARHADRVRPARPRRRRRCGRSPVPADLAAGAEAVRAVTVAPEVTGYIVDIARATRSVAVPVARASAPAARPRCWRPAARGPGSTAAASSPPTTSRRSPTPRSRTGCRCARRPSSRASTSARCWPARSAPCRSPAERWSAGDGPRSGTRRRGADRAVPAAAAARAGGRRHRPPGDHGAAVVAGHASPSSVSTCCWRVSPRRLVVDREPVAQVRLGADGASSLLLTNPGTASVRGCAPRRLAAVRRGATASATGSRCAAASGPASRRRCARPGAATGRPTG